jgi:peptidoglycan hydrolase-like protein with peptidoglycan-binding domain
VKVNSYEALIAAEARQYDPPGSGESDPADGDVVEDLAKAALVERGDRGTGVAQLQESLMDLGYDVGPLDGIFGGLTEAAVVTLQIDYRLDADGRVGSITKGAIAGLLRPDGTILGFGRRGDEVAVLQTELSEAGVDAGSADGVFGPKTLEAVITFQRDFQLTVDGLVGPQTWGALEMR